MKELFEQEILLSDHTSIALGGPAKYFYRASDLNELSEVLKFTAKDRLTTFILGEGSNVVFPDKGFDGLVIKNQIKGIISESHNGSVRYECASGENWDSFVSMTVEKGYAGAECMSGIPGTVGATPVQNVGAYGQEVKDIIEEVKVLDLQNWNTLTISKSDCDFTYRSSRFKSKDKGRYFIQSVTFNLSDSGDPELFYPSLREALQNSSQDYSALGRTEKLKLVRNKVVSIRKSKSMLLDTNDPNSRSCGSFFMNPVLSKDKFMNLSNKHKVLLDAPLYPSGDSVKTSAAWLIEKAGFSRGCNYKGAGLSQNHVLAIVNRGGSSADVIELSDVIRSAVYLSTEILLQTEPEIVD